MGTTSGLERTPLAKEANNNSEDEALRKAGYQNVDGALLPQPLSQPEFTLSELRNAIPPHCLVRSTWKSLGYLTLDLVIISSLFGCAYVVLEQISLPFYLKIFGYVTYWFLQGSFLFAIWVLGHECGHSAFSEIDLVNDLVGLFVHTVLLIPYHSFKFTHRIHHGNTGSVEHDVGFIPSTKSEIEPSWSEALQESPLYNFYQIIQTLLFGMQAFLVVMACGPTKYNNKPRCHFNPKAAFFLPKQRSAVVLSDFAFILVVAIIGYFTSVCGFSVVMRLYIVPYIVMNAFLVTITYLQHTDTYVPHFREGEWNWLRGALCTVDRSYGKFLDKVFHHLTDTHICHHIFPKMPFYHCLEATEAIKPILGKYYLRDPTPIPLALWRVVNYCKYIDDDGKVLFYRKKLIKVK